MRFYSLLLLIILSTTIPCFAQQDILFQDTMGVVIHADPRLAVLADYLKPKLTTNNGSSGSSSSRRSGVIRSGRGYRVQIYNGNERVKATTLKIDFIRRYPGMRAYMTYIQPQFRLKVGDFRTRGDAQRFVEQVKSFYSPVMIVPDIIVINTFKDDPYNQTKN